MTILFGSGTIHGTGGIIRFLSMVRGTGIIITGDIVTGSMNPQFKDIPMMKMLLLLWTSLALIGCATGISKQIRSQVTYQDTFSELQKQSQDLAGETVLFGGKIINTQNREGITVLTILHLPLDSRDRPQDNDRSEGRFLVFTDRFLDPAVYTKGYLVTVVGKLVSIEKRPIGGLEYRYPKIEAQEIKLWKPDYNAVPRIRFGVGIGATF